MPAAPGEAPRQGGNASREAKALRKQLMQYFNNEGATLFQEQYCWCFSWNKYWPLSGPPISLQNSFSTWCSPPVFSQFLAKSLELLRFFSPGQSEEIFNFYLTIPWSKWGIFFPCDQNVELILIFFPGQKRDVVLIDYNSVPNNPQTGNNVSSCIMWAMVLKGEYWGGGGVIGNSVSLLIDLNNKSRNFLTISWMSGQILEPRIFRPVKKLWPCTIVVLMAVIRQKPTSPM